MATTVSNPPEQQPGDGEVEPIVDPLTNPVVDPVSDPLNPTVGVDSKSDLGPPSPPGDDTVDASNPYSDVPPTVDDVNGLTETAEFDGTPL